MRKHLSVLALAARGTVWRVLAVTLLAAVLSGALLWLIPALEPDAVIVAPDGTETPQYELVDFCKLPGKTGAAIARHVYGVDDEVYQAILYHTTGRANMTLLEKILYLADYIEPSREVANDPDVVRLRETVYEDLDRGLLLGLTMTIQEMEELGNPVNHLTRDARDYLLKRGIR